MGEKYTYEQLPPLSLSSLRPALCGGRGCGAEPLIGGEGSVPKATDPQEVLKRISPEARCFLSAPRLHACSVVTSACLSATPLQETVAWRGRTHPQCR